MSIFVSLGLLQVLTSGPCFGIVGSVVLDEGKHVTLSELAAQHFNTVGGLLVAPCLIVDIRLRLILGID